MVLNQSQEKDEAVAAIDSEHQTNYDTLLTRFQLLEQTNKELKADILRLKVIVGWFNK